jgi:phage N-6-adenine-methyltransferase
MANDTWATPVWLFEYAQQRYGQFDLDVCAAHDSYKCKPYYTIEDNSLTLPWRQLNWCNPPYSNIRPWIEKAALELNQDNSTVMLLPADFSTRWFKLVWELSSEILIINQRVKFVGATSSPKFASFFCLISPLGLNLEAPNVQLIDPQSFANKLS